MTAFPVNGETCIICGGRDFTDSDMFNSAMFEIIAMRGCPSKVIHGAASGADDLADKWAKRMGIAAFPTPAMWASQGKAAGPIRNQKMLDAYHPNAVIAFPGGSGTADMVRRGRSREGCDVIEIQTKGDPAVVQP